MQYDPNTEAHRWRLLRLNGCSVPGELQAGVGSGSVGDQVTQLWAFIEREDNKFQQFLSHPLTTSAQNVRRR